MKQIGTIISAQFFFHHTVPYRTVLFASFKGRHLTIDTGGRWYLYYCRVWGLSCFFLSDFMPRGPSATRKRSKSSLTAMGKIDCPMVQCWYYLYGPACHRCDVYRVSDLVLLLHGVLYDIKIPLSKYTPSQSYYFPFCSGHGH